MRLVVRGLGLVVVIAAILVGVSRVDDTPQIAQIVVKAEDTGGVVRPGVWDEINLWKLYGWFGIHFDDLSDGWGEGWLRRQFPWVRYARVVAPLGGSYGPAIAESCDHAERTSRHTPAADCGTDGAPGPAAQNETVQWVDGDWVIDYTPFQSAIERLVRSGLKPHINFSGMPVAFTGGEGNYRHYHWNAKPPDDLDAWLAFLRGALESIEHLDRTGWRVSIINEPNCLLPDENGVIHPVGFAGDPETYARTWVAAAKMIREVAPEVAIHPGNYVASSSFPGENNVHLYLAALRDELEREPSLSWEDMPYVGLSVYEVLEASLAEFPTERFQRLADAQTVNGLEPRRLKLDELGIHQNVREPYRKHATQNLDTTLFTASWHAEALRSFVEGGDIVSASPWFDVFYTRPDWATLPTAYVYRMFGLLAGQLQDADPSDDLVWVRETGMEDGLPQLGVSMHTPRHGHVYSSIGALATEAPDGVVRLLVVHHQPELMEDDDPRRKSLTLPTRITFRGLEPGAFAIRHASVGGDDGAQWDGEAMRGFAWRDDGCHEVSASGSIQVPGVVDLPANSVWLYELEAGDCDGLTSS